MRFSRLYAVFLRQIFLMRGSFTRVLPLFAWAGIEVVLWGFISRYLNAVSHPTGGLDFVATLLGAVLLWNFFIRVMQGVAMAFLEDVWSRNFLNIFASPLTLPEYVGGLVLSSVVTSAVGLVAMLVVAMAVFGLSFFAFGIWLVFFLSVLFLFGIALGIFASAILLRLGPASEWFVWPIPGILSPFAGVFYPLSTLPHWMQIVGRLLPVSYVFEGVRAIASGHVPSHTALLTGVGLSVVDITLASWFFASTYRYAVRTGLIARYSAESVS